MTDPQADYHRYLEKMAEPRTLTEADEQALAALLEEARKHD